MDMSAKELLQQSVALFFAVGFFLIGISEFRKMRRDMNAQAVANVKALTEQTAMMHDCFLWLGSLIRADKKIPPPTSPGLPGFHTHKRHSDPPDNGSYPTPKPPSNKPETE
jgi:hypothetical protein